MPHKLREDRIKYMRTWREKNPERAKELSKRYYLKHRKKLLIQHRKYHRKVKLLAMKRLCDKEIIKCERCGCDDMKVLEINHKNLGGYKELRGGNHSSTYFYIQVAKGLRDTFDLNVLCKVCNMTHYVETKFNKKYEIKLIQDGTGKSLL